MPHRSLGLPLLLLSTVAVVLGLAAQACDRPPDLGLSGRIAAARDRDANAADAEADDGPRFDFALPPPGVPDHGRSLGLVVIEVGVAARCTAALVASNVAAVPARCVASPTCVPIAAADLAVRTSDAEGADLGPVREILVPEGDACDGAALAAIVLAQHADGLSPFAVRARPAARGERARFVALRRDGVRIDRDHVPIVASSLAGVALEGGACDVAPGGALIDEATGELLAVGAFAVAEGQAEGAAGAGAGCASDAIRLLGIDRARPVLDAAFALAHRPLVLEDGGLLDAGAPRRGKAARPTTDLGESCESAGDCAAGVCVTERDGAPYCSRPCGPGDRCPTGLRCVTAGEGRSACIRSG